MYNKEEEALLKGVILDMEAVLKNYQIYSPGHSIIVSFLEKFEKSLEHLLELKGEVSLGVTPESLMLEGKYFERDNSVFHKITNFFHTRAISLFSFSKGVTLNEIKVFFENIIGTREEMLKKGGLAQILAKQQVTHIKVIDLDYSSVIAREETGESGVDKDEQQFWEILINNLSEGLPDIITEDTIKVFDKALTNSIQTATSFNKSIYDDPNKLQDVTRIVKRLAICAKENLFEQDIENKKHLEEILSNLDPALINSIIKDDNEFKEEHDKFMQFISSSVTEDAISKIIESIVVKENKFSDKILSVVNEMCRYDEKKISVANTLTMLFLDRGIFAWETAIGLIDSVKALATANPHDKFITQFYRNISFCIDNSVEQFKGELDKSAGLIAGYMRTISREAIDMDFAELTFELIKEEKDPKELELLTERFFDEVPNLISHGGLGILNEFLVTFAADSAAGKDVSSAKRGLLDRHIHQLTVPDIINSMIKDVAEADEEGFETASQIILMLGINSVRLLLEAAFMQKNLELVMDRLASILFRMGGGISDEITLWLEGKPDKAYFDLVPLLYKIDTDEIFEYLENIYSKRGIELQRFIAQMISQAPKQRGAGILRMGLKANDEQIRNVSIEGLIKMKDKVYASMLVEKLKVKNPFGSKDKEIMDVIELLKRLGAEESVPHLAELFYQKPFPFWVNSDNLRVAIIYTLSEIASDEALEIIAKGADDKSKAVRDVCQYILNEKSKG